MESTLHLNAGLGWPFMVACLSFVGALWVAPYALARAITKLHEYRWNPYRMMLADTELRMMVGFVMNCVGTAIFAGSSYIRSLMIVAGQTALLASYTEAARFYLLIPSAVLMCIGDAFMLWDGLSAGRGKWACVILVSLAWLFWYVGQSSSPFLIWYLWGPDAPF